MVQPHFAVTQLERLEPVAKIVAGEAFALLRHHRDGQNQSVGGLGFFARGRWRRVAAFFLRFHPPDLLLLAQQLQLVALYHRVRRERRADLGEIRHQIRFFLRRVFRGGALPRALGEHRAESSLVALLFRRRFRRRRWCRGWRLVGGFAFLHRGRRFRLLQLFVDVELVELFERAGVLRRARILHPL